MFVDCKAWAEYCDAMSTEENELQRDIICAYLVRETEAWLGARALADRAVGLDS